jgi:thiol-disulfide isomerase/thioredoxin
MEISKIVFHLWAVFLIPFLLLEGFYFYRKDIQLVEKHTKNLRSHIGQPFPFEYIFDSSGNRISPSSFKTDITILDFWFGECPPCIAEMKKFETALKGKDKHISIYSVSIDEFDAWKNLFHSENSRYDFLKKDTKGWHHAILQPIVDSFPNASGYILSKFFTSTYPCIFVLDKNGIIKDVPVSAVDYIKTNFSNEPAYFVYLETQIKEKGFFYLFSISLIFYSGIFWIIFFLIFSIQKIIQTI